MHRNGFNKNTKRNIASIKTGKYHCPICSLNAYVDISFWDEHIALIMKRHGEYVQCLRNGGASLRRIAMASEFNLPFQKSSIFNQFTNFIENLEYIPLIIKGKIAILCFDEEYLKICGKWRYRLTLLDFKTRLPIAEKISPNITNKDISKFIKKNFDSTPYEKVFVVTDLKSGYKDILFSIFGDKLVHQYCLFHLCQLIMDEFPKSAPISEKLQQYQLLNIFYDYENEVNYLKSIIRDEKTLNDVIVTDNNSLIMMEKDEMMAEFMNIHNSHKNELREPEAVFQKIYDLLEEKDELSPNIQKRLVMIQESLGQFLAYRLIEGAPSTNNAIEGYFSYTTNPILKRQMKTERGAENFIKSYAIERQDKFIKFMDGKSKSKNPITFSDLIFPLRLFGPSI
jgi:hypothetical protein